MLLEITTTHQPATDLGFLLHKHPLRVQRFELPFGLAHVFFSEARDDRSTAVMMLEVDPVGLVRNRRGPSGEAFALEQYVNDRPYVASSFMSVAISRVFGTALSGICKTKPELVSNPIPLTARLQTIPCNGGEAFIRQLFEPLGYQVQVTAHPLDEKFPEWGASRYFSIELSAASTLERLLSHLYVLIPVLDNDKHYWIGDDEVEKLLRHGEGWLSAHPAREQIVNRYLKHRKYLARSAMEQLIAEEAPDVDKTAETHEHEEQEVERPISLNQRRLDAVVETLRKCGAKRVLDLGCSYGNLLRELLAEKQFEFILGMDVSYRAIEIAADRLNFDRLPAHKRERISLIQGSLTYRDNRLRGFDAAAIVEVIEHLDEFRLASFERVVFESARPETVIVTTPNVEYNVRFPTLPAGKFRHRDHRFEWTRSQFQDWAQSVAKRFSYSVEFQGIGDQDTEVGTPTQMAVFSVVNQGKL